MIYYIIFDYIICAVQSARYQALVINEINYNINLLSYKQNLYLSLSMEDTSH